LETNYQKVRLKAMESKVKLLGHPIHPMLIVLPLGLLGMSVIFDIIYLITNDPVWTFVAFYMIGAGVIGGLLAAIFGLLDYLAIPASTRAKSVGMMHGGGNVVVVALFAVSWWLRHDSPANPGITPIILSIVGVLISLSTAWLGGELVDRMHVGVDEGGHLNSPSSLSGQPASANTTGAGGAVTR
jgi:uncharacterized membrane protein